MAYFKNSVCLKKGRKRGTEKQTTDGTSRNKISSNQDVRTKPKHIKKYMKYKYDSSN